MGQKLPRFEKMLMIYYKEIYEQNLNPNLFFPSFLDFSEFVYKESNFFHLGLIRLPPKKLKGLLHDY